MSDLLDSRSWLADKPTRAVIAALEAKGGHGCARFVGGCVRDAILGREVDDIDIATQLTPPEVIDALQAARLRAVPTGIEHGTVTAIADHRPFEITTLRRDVETDGRRAVVAFTRDWREDAERRDFRLNALYLDLDGRLYDPVGGGMEDARAGRIVFVGEAETRIREDYLRILRFFRFTAWFGRGDPDPKAVEACTALRAGIDTLSGERLAKEMLKLLAAPDPRRALTLMRATGVLAVVLPFALALDRLEAMAPLTSDPQLRLAALLPDDPAAVRAAADRLRLSNDLRDRLVEAASEPRLSLDLTPSQTRAALYRMGAVALRDRLLKRLAERPDADTAARRLLALAGDWRPPRFPLTGSDAMAAGIPRGPEIGRVLHALEDRWIAGDFTQSRAELLKALASKAGEQR